VFFRGDQHRPLIVRLFPAYATRSPFLASIATLAAKATVSATRAHPRHARSPSGYHVCLFSWRGCH